MRVLVTGGTGFVGGWSAKAIADAGHSVRFLVRNPDRLQTSVAKLGVDVSDHSVGDITDRDSVMRALEGCDAVLHSAALVATDPSQTAQMMSTNMDGARNVMGGAVELGLDPMQGGQQGCRLERSSDPRHGIQIVRLRRAGHRR